MIVQPQVAEAVGLMPTDVTWVFGRDGFLTCHDALGRWWAGCSLPKRAGMAMLKTLEVRGVMGCFLAPAHAGQLAAALEILRPEQAVLVIQPDLIDMRVMLGSCDFSRDIASHRLWFATGGDWPEMLTATFADHPGLPTPARFIRTQTTDDEIINQLIPAAEKVLNAVNDSRARQLAETQNAECRMQNGVHSAFNIQHSAFPRLLLVAPSHFRLWDDAGHALLTALTSDHARHLDPDDPAESSAMGLALAAMESDVIVVPNLARAGLPAVLPDRVAVLSWITQPRIPAFDATFSRDGLLLADSNWVSVAHAAGWPMDRLTVAAWPTRIPAPAVVNCLALLADTCTLETPITRLEASSHHLLWEMIRAELAANPFALGSDVIGFIDRRRVKLGIAEEGFDRAMFIDKLVVPAYQQGLARILLEAGVPLRLYGSAWDQIPELRDAAGGTVETREKFDEAIARASALVYAWPMRYQHPIDSLARPVLVPGRSADQWVRDAKNMLRATSREKAETPQISRHIIEKICR